MPASNPSFSESEMAFLYDSCHATASSYTDELQYGLKQIFDICLGDINPKLTWGGDCEHQSLLDMTDEIGTYIVEEQRVIFDEMLPDIIEYLREYEVSAKKIDIYKIAYWFGLTLSNLYVQKNKFQHATMVRLAMIRVMDEFLYTDIKQKLDKNMRLKMTKTILEMPSKDKDPLYDAFGKYGIYLIYKNVFKICVECCPLFGAATHMSKWGSFVSPSMGSLR